MSVKRLQAMGRDDALDCSDVVARDQVGELANESWSNVASSEAEDEGLEEQYGDRSAEDIYCAAFIKAYSERYGWIKASAAKPKAKPTPKSKPKSKPKPAEPPWRGLTEPGDPDGVKLAAVKRYVESGADVNALLPQGRVFMQSLLHLAAATHHVEVMRYLLAHGADPNLANGTNGERPLHAAIVSADDPAAAALLLAHGAKVDPRSQPGNTPLHDAVILERVQIVELLLAHGADPRLETPYLRIDGQPSTARAICEDQLKRGRPGQARIKELLDRVSRA
jgi:hypothetical protein